MALGDLTARRCASSATLARRTATARCASPPEQNLRVPLGARRRRARAVLVGSRPQVWALAGAGTLADVTSCPGAESCRLAVTQSRGLGRLLADRLGERPDLVAKVAGSNIKISGCPNGCGQHHIAGIGFQGSLRKVGGRPAPHYFVMVGGGTANDTSFGRFVASIPARRSVEALERLIDLYTQSHESGESAPAFFRRVEVPVVKAALANLAVLAPAEATDDDFVDLGDDVEFQPDVMDGECSTYGWGQISIF